MTKEIRDIGTDWIEVHEERNNDSLIELLLSIVHDRYKPIQNMEDIMDVCIYDEIEVPDIWKV